MGESSVSKIFLEFKLLYYHVPGQQQGRLVLLTWSIGESRRIKNNHPLATNENVNNESADCNAVNYSAIIGRASRSREIFHRSQYCSSRVSALSASVAVHRSRVPGQHLCQHPCQQVGTTATIRQRTAKQIMPYTYIWIRCR